MTEGIKLTNSTTITADRLIKMYDFTVSDIDKNATAILYYNPNKREYKLELQAKDKLIHRTWNAGYEPRFGVDVADATIAEEKLEEMLQELPQ